MADLRVLEDDTLLDSDTCSDDDTGTDADVGAELGGRVDICGRVDEDGWDNVGAGLSELFAAGLSSLLEVEGVGGDGGASSLDLAPEILGLVDIKLLTVGHVAENVLLETDDLVLLVALLILIVLGDVAVLEVIGRWVGDETRRTVEAALDGSTDRGEDGFGGEEVDTAVDEVADAALGLLNVMQNTTGVSIGDDATKVVGRLVADSSSQNDSLGILLNEELQHLSQGEGAAHIGIEDKETLRATLEDGISEVVQTAGGSQGLVFAEVLDGELGELLGGILDEVAEDGFVVVADDVDFLDLLVGDAGDGGEAVPDDGVAGDFKERLGDVERERTEASASRGAADLEMRFGLALR